MEADELWSFVGGEGRVCWVWAALDADTRQVVAMVAGDRSEGTARRLRAALPAGYRDRAVVCTDFWSAYLAAVPEHRHAAGGKDSGLTCGIERFWCTARQRCARLVRRAPSFSRCWRNHLGALWCFIRHYNQSRRRGHYRAGTIVAGPGRVACAVGLTGNERSGSNCRYVLLPVFSSAPSPGILCHYKRCTFRRSS